MADRRVFQTGQHCFASDVIVDYMSKKKKSKKESPSAIRAMVMKEMAQPRFAKSARKE
jgi:hypothetical protein